jgi:transposase
VPLPTRVFLACGVTDMRKRFGGLTVLVQQALAHNPHWGALFAFRSKRGHLVKLLRFDVQGLCLFSKRLDRDQSLPTRVVLFSLVMSSAHRRAD